MRSPGMPVVGLVDHNPPVYQVVPTYGPDKQSRRMAFWNWLRASSFVSAATGTGVRPAPSGASTSENVKTAAALPPQQAFRGVTVRLINDPSIASLAKSGMYPATSDQTGPPWMSYLGQLNTGISAGMFGGDS